MKHSPGFLKLVDDAKSRIREVTVAETQNRLKANPAAKLIDVREDREWDDSHAAGAEHLGKGIIERDIENQVPEDSTELITQVVHVTIIACRSHVASRIISNVILWGRLTQKLVRINLDVSQGPRRT